MEIDPLNKIHLASLPTIAPVAPDESARNRQVVTAVKALNKSELLGEDNELEFSRDPHTQRPVIQLIDRNTKEVIRQIPPEYVLQAAADLLQQEPS